MSGGLRHAERVLASLGITEPREIDVEAIAWHLGAKVKYRELDTCEARIWGMATARSSASTAANDLSGANSPSRMNSAIGPSTADNAWLAGPTTSATAPVALTTPSGLLMASPAICCSQPTSASDVSAGSAVEPRTGPRDSQRVRDQCHRDSLSSHRTRHAARLLVCHNKRGGAGSRPHLPCHRAGFPNTTWTTTARHSICCSGQHRSWQRRALSMPMHGSINPTPASTNSRADLQDTERRSHHACTARLENV